MLTLHVISSSLLLTIVSSQLSVAWTQWLSRDGAAALHGTGSLAWLPACLLAWMADSVHHVPCAPFAVTALLAQRDAITNWDQFAVANNISGWTLESAASVCSWTGVSCNGAGEVSRL